MKRYQLLSLGLIFMLYGFNTATAQNADSLLRYMDNLMLAPSDKEATVKIILKDKTGKEKVREALMKQKGKDKKLYRYTLPESQAGISTLSLPDGVMWLYMPAFGKPTKISLLAKSQTFTGTDFSYEDMENKAYSERYTPTLLESDNSESYLLELIPISDKSKYSKIILHLNKTHYYPMKMEYYDIRGNIYKVAIYKYTKKGKYWYAEEVMMTNLKKAHSTGIVMTDVKFDQGLSDDEFSVENLK